jgi:hypothetical protein
MSWEQYVCGVAGAAGLTWSYWLSSGFIRVDKKVDLICDRLGINGYAKKNRRNGSDRRKR